VEYRCSHAGFQLQTTRGLGGGTPLPDEVTAIWKPRQAQRGGAAIEQWGPSAK